MKASRKRSTGLGVKQGFKTESVIIMVLLYVSTPTCVQRKGGLMKHMLEIRTMCSLRLSDEHNFQGSFSGDGNTLRHREVVIQDYRFFAVRGYCAVVNLIETVCAGDALAVFPIKAKPALYRWIVINQNTFAFWMHS
jgi:hypothetical protein